MVVWNFTISACAANENSAIAAAAASRLERIIGDLPGFTSRNGRLGSSAVPLQPASPTEKYQGHREAESGDTPAHHRRWNATPDAGGNYEVGPCGAELGLQRAPGDRAWLPQH